MPEVYKPFRLWLWCHVEVLSFLIAGIFRDGDHRFAYQTSVHVGAALSPLGNLFRETFAPSHNGAGVNLVHVSSPADYHCERQYKSIR